MKLPNTLIEKAICRDDSTTLDKIRYNAENGMVEAGDGFICALVPIGEDNPYGTFFLTAAAADYARANDSDFFVREKNYIQVKDATFDPPASASFPKDLTKLVPDNDDMEHVMSIDVDLLYRLAQAICPVSKLDNPHQKLHVNLFVAKEDSHKSSVVISCQDAERNVGVLMPMHNKRAAPSYEKPTKS